jgi:hypothetical protein
MEQSLERVRNQQTRSGHHIASRAIVHKRSEIRQSSQSSGVHLIFIRNRGRRMVVAYMKFKYSETLEKIRLLSSGSKYRRINLRNTANTIDII